MLTIGCKRLDGETNYKPRQLFTLWSNMIFLLDTQKINIRSLIIVCLKFYFRTFLREYVDYNKSKKIIIKSKTFKHKLFLKFISL